MMIAQAVMMVLLIAIAAVTGGRPWSRLALVAAAGLMGIGYGRRALLQLRQLEQTHTEPDAVMVMLFDLSLGVPTLGLIAVIVGATS